MLGKQVNLDSYLKIVLKLLPLNITEKLDCQKHSYISSFKGIIRQIFFTCNPVIAGNLKNIGRQDPNSKKRSRLLDISKILLILFMNFEFKTIKS